MEETILVHDIKFEPKVYGDRYHLMVAQDLLRCHLGELEWQRRFDDYEEMFAFVVDVFKNWQYWDEISHVDEPWIESFTEYINHMH